jgi:hypothetical protein
MEYLMSYGWAIVMVMIVGAAMYGLGILRPGSGPASSSGFNVLKPMLATCEFKQKVWWGQIPDPSSGDGFFCQFMNYAGKSIVVRNTKVTVNGGNCAWDFVSTTPYVSNPWCPSDTVYFFHTNPDYNTLFCRDDRTCTSPPCDGITFQDKQVFWVLAISPTLSANNPCNVHSGVRNDVQIVIDYDISIGGNTVRKTDMGTVHVTSTPEM